MASPTKNDSVGKVRILLLIVGSLLIAANGTLSGPKMLFCLPGFPGNSSTAQPYVDKMLRYLERKLSWETGSASGLYLNDGAVASKTLLKTRPKIALVGPSIYAARSGALKMKVIAKVEVNGRGERTYSVVTKKTGAAALNELRGQTVEGAVVHDEKYALNVLLDGQMKPGDLIFKSEKKPLRALRNVVRGKCGAAIVDDEVVGHIKSLPFATELKVIYTSQPIPAPAAVVMNASKAEINALKSTLVGMCQKPESRDLCKTLTLSSIKSATAADYTNLLAKYNR